jgi:hypothetical protein
MDAHYVRTKFQRFVSDAPRSSFKKLNVSTSRLLHNLHTMSLAKAVLDGLKDCECKKIALCKRPPIPYVPEKDSVQETVSAYKDNHLKTLTNEGTELQVPIWHSGTCEVFLIHVGSAREATKKKGYFKSYKEYSGTFADNRNKVKQLRSQLAELDETSGTYRNSSKNSKETTIEASSTSSTLCADIMAELKQAMEATEEATTKCDKAAEDISSSMPTFCLSMQGRRGTRLSRSRPMPTPTQTSKS